MQAVIKQTQEPEMKALMILLVTTSIFLGIKVPKVDIIIPTDPGFAKPQRA